MFKAAAKKLESYMDKNIQNLDRNFTLIEEISYFILEWTMLYLIKVITDYIFGIVNGF